MKWAIFNSQRILATPLKKENVLCPLCKKEVIAKCGSIKIWHWAHKNNECDNWSEPESEWHLNWKNEFPSDWQEVIIQDCNCLSCKQYNKECKHDHESYCCEIIKHRADIKTKHNLIIEFQNSNISKEEIIERENFYKKVVWVLNGFKFAQNLILRKKENYYTFRWKWPPQSWFNSKKEIYIDLKPLSDKYYKYYLNEEEEFLKEIYFKKFIEYSDNLFLIKRIFNKLPTGGWGKIISKENFIRRIYDGNI